jgi:glutathione synthase/RimK-type ligase-like ATP-grasp enzyme
MVSNHWKILSKIVGDSITVFSPRDYVTQPDLGGTRPVKVYNFCSDIGYQQLGYYVSLLAEARGHKVIPNVATLRDFNDASSIKQVGAEMDTLIQRSLAPLQSDDFTLSIYFSCNLARRYDKLCSHIYGLFPAPLMRAFFKRDSGVWKLRKLHPISVKDVPQEHHEFLSKSIAEFFKKKKAVSLPSRWRFDLAILVNPKEKPSPSNPKALQLFAKAANQLGMYTEFIGKQDFSRISEFDALFIRETTQVNHHTYRFARRAQAEGLVVIDDPDSIMRCANKVYLAELLTRQRIPIPKTLVVHQGNRKEVSRQIGFPCILKKPDSSFSQGVFKVENEAMLQVQLENLFRSSALIIAQEFLPTEFDWRIGVMDRRPIYACKYYMASKHWQIVRRDGRGKEVLGRSDAVPTGWVPRHVLQLAVKAANLMGDGLYGVDIKETDGRAVIIEINDNPSIDGGVEDGVLRDELYHLIMNTILTRIEERKKRL